MHVLFQICKDIETEEKMQFEQFPPSQHPISEKIIFKIFPDWLLRGVLWLTREQYTDNFGVKMTESTSKIHVRRNYDQKTMFWGSNNVQCATTKNPQKNIPSKA